VVSGIDDPVVTTEQFLARVLRDLTELVVDVGDPAGNVGGRDDRGMVDGTFEIGELIEIGYCHGRASFVYWTACLPPRF
jgi:hypothetical protein